MLRFVAILVSLVAGVTLGVLATLGGLRGDPPWGAVREGPWVAWPRSGAPTADPYARAVFSRDGRVPLAAAVGLRFFATTDDAGRLLEGRCDYTLSGAMPAAQDWTVTVLEPDGGPRNAPPLRAGFTSTEVVRAANGAVTIALARAARPGNWLPVHGDAPFKLMLSLYETPLGSTLDAGGLASAMPVITAVACP